MQELGNSATIFCLISSSSTTGDFLLSWSSDLGQLSALRKKGQGFNFFPDDDQLFSTLYEQKKLTFIRQSIDRLRRVMSSATVNQ